MTTAFEHGEIVNVTFEGVQIFPTEIADVYRIAYKINRPAHEGNVRHATFTTESDEVTVERVAPPEWPPVAGDLWRDKHDVLWFASESDQLRMHSASGGRWSVGHEGQLADNAPWSLVYREANPPAVTP